MNIVPIFTVLNQLKPKKMLDTIYFSKLRNSQHMQFIQDVINVCEKYTPDTLYIRAPFDNLKNHYQQMKSVFVTAQGSTITSDLESEDMKRDSLYIGIKYTIFGYTKHFEEEKVSAATALTTHIKKYGSGIPDLEYNAETAVLNDLIEGIESDTELTADTVTLRINDWFAELKASNDEFNRLYGLRAEKESQKTKLKLKELRNESVKLYRTMADYLHAASIMHPDPVFKKTENELNEFINKFNNIN